MMKINISERLVDSILEIERDENYDGCEAMLVLKELAEIIERKQLDDMPSGNLSYIDTACVAIYGEEYLEEMTR